jgi:hypothetical protein
MHTGHPDSLPLVVSDEERLARAIFYPNHINNSGRLKPAAFRAKGGRRDVSVNRLVALDANACKARSQEIGLAGIYKGFAVITALCVRQCGSDVADSRSEYWGHADIMHDQIVAKGEPAPAEFNERLKRMAEASQYFPDPAPETVGWTGEDFSSGQ